jgi:hypothetical protein
MAKNITIPKEYGDHYVKVWLNGKEHMVYTGKEVTVGDAIYEVLKQMMENKQAPASPDAENFRIFFKTDGTKVTCNRSYAEVIDMAKKGANIIAEYEEEGDTYIMNSAFIKNADKQITFSCITALSDGIKCLGINYYSVGSCEKILLRYSG